MTKPIVLTLLFVGCCSAYTKQWLPNTNFDNPSNWNVGRIPCSNDNIFLTGVQEESVSVFLQTNTTIKEMTLPNNGVITLSDNMVLSFSDNNLDPTCDGQDVAFIRGSSKYWFNPNNWASQDEPVLVETEKIPCQYDDVIFPEGGRFYIYLDTHVTINSLRFAGKVYTTTSFASFLRSDDGSEQFYFGNAVSPPHVNIVNNVCTDVTGCPCGNDNQQTKDKICDSFECLGVLCKDAILPVGGCCYKCGAVLTMIYDREKFNLAELKKAINERFGNQVEYADVSISTSKTRENKIQVVCVDTTDGHTAVTMAIALDEYLINNMDELGLTNITMQTSGKGIGRLIGKHNISGGAVAGIIICLLIALAVCTVIILLYRKGWCTRQEKPLSLEMELGIAKFVTRSTEPVTTLTAFDNPMYDTTPLEMPDPIFASPEVFSEEHDGSVRGFTNPVNIETSFEISLDDEIDDNESDIDDDDKKMIITPDNETDA